MKHLAITILIIITCISTILATHNRAGEITYKQLSDYAYEVTVITYTNTRPTSTGFQPADRPELDIYWGDDTYSTVQRDPPVDLPNYYRRNVYVAQHTFPGPGTYEIYVEDPNRNEGVQNIPNSVNIVFSIKTILTINPSLGFNNTPILLNPPVDKAALGEIFIHNPAAYDPDGDSISYKLTICTGENGEPIDGYRFPPASNSFYMNESTGDLIWDVPVDTGSFNVALQIEEWRNGIRLGRITRDMQIEVYNTENNPPYIDSIPDVCVEANDTVMFNVTAHDNSTSPIKLTGNGGVFLIDNPAIFPENASVSPVTAPFFWETNCSNVRKQPYLVVFKAEDNDPEISLVDIKNVNIYVNGPAPKNLALEPSNNSIFVSWSPSECTQAIGYKLYRSTTESGFIHDDCTRGVPPDVGYELVAVLNDISDTTYMDNNDGFGLFQGYNYCYMVVATYPDKVDSYASEEVCTRLIKGIPVITNVSVLETDPLNGQIYVAWSKPTELDTTLALPPFKYKIYRSADLWGSNFVLIDSLYEQGLNDTLYIDSVYPLNTQNFPYSYKIELHNDEGLVDQPMIASSIFLSFIPNDNQLEIEFNKNTPWMNHQYVVYKENGINNFDSIGTSITNSYTDRNLVNGDTYCYMVKSIGSYDLPGYVNPIENDSHKNCGIPEDKTPPPPPVLTVYSICDSALNHLSWENEIWVDDIISYNVYYSTDVNTNLQFLTDINDRDSNFFDHFPTVGLGACYEVTAIDSFQNESIHSNRVCIDSCKYYELPNVFTPNGDNYNPYFIPTTSKRVIDLFIDKVEFKVFNRWGNLVFETDNIYLDWDGTNSTNGKLVSDGVYYYVCNVYERRITGSEPRYLVGFIHIFQSTEAGVAE
jgi:gliding motility-associated-like protein